MNLHIAVLTLHEDTSGLFKQILDAANDKFQIYGLEQSSFSYDLPDDGIAKISGYLHVNKTGKLAEAVVRTWISDDRIKGEVEWTPVFRTFSWQKWGLSLIRDILAACDGGSGLCIRKVCTALIRSQQGFYFVDLEITS